MDQKSLVMTVLESSGRGDSRPQFLSLRAEPFPHSWIRCDPGRILEVMTKEIYSPFIIQL